MRTISVMGLCAFLWVSCSPAPVGDEHGIEVRLIRTTKGWGYEILVEDTVFIHQPHIPVVSGTMPFASEGQASRVGYLVRDRLLQKQFPLVTKDDLIELGILMDTNWATPSSF